MKVQYASDLHLEFYENKEFLRANPLKPKGDILLLGGDIIPFAIMDKHGDFFDYISDSFEITYWLPGNHEYYNFDLGAKYGTFKESIRSNVFLLNNQSVEHNKVKFIFSTLWTKISPAHQLAIQQSVTDFHAIKFNKERFTPVHFNEVYKESISFIEGELKNTNTDKTVVVTHHVPTFINYPKQYKSSNLNEAFAVELAGLIEKSKIDYWIYGHHHCNVPDFKIGNTIMATNQLGYVKYNENAGFALQKTIGHI